MKKYCVAFNLLLFVCVANLSVGAQKKFDKSMFRCADRETSEIWKLVKKTEFVTGYLRGETETGDCKDYLAITKRIDLNDDGADELYVEGGSKISPATFRPSWIFQKTANGYRLLLEERDDKFKILKEITEGFHDLYFVSRRTTRTISLSTYQYKNGKYESVKCLVSVPFGDGQQAKLFNCANQKGIEEFEKENGRISNKP